MSVIKLKPTSPGQRFTIKADRRKLHKGKPCKTLLESKSKQGGRNNTGRITVRHIGGGSKSHYRKVDFLRDKDNIPAKVERIEYDPNRTAYLALVLYADGERKYIICPNNLNVGDEVISGPNSPIKAGNTLSLEHIPLGTTIHAVEMIPGKGAQLARSAGTYVQLVAKDNKFALIRLRSGETRNVPVECKATIGEVSNSSHNLICLGKAGAKRHRGVRPTVRGVAMNPIDHPHGGGEGRTSGGRHPCTPWGIATKGYKTRKNKRTDKLIVRRRK